jgi:hypothetical protein
MFNQVSFIPRSDVVDAIAHLRTEWEQGIEGESLMDMKTSIGLLLADLSATLSFTPEEQVQALGQNLVNNLQSIMEFATAE